MNQIFFALWLLLSLGLVYFMVWTMFILQRQKQGWKAFAIKHKLRYKGAKMFSSPEVKGVYKGYTISLFTGEHTTEDVRGTRKMTAIELMMPDPFPFSGAAASEGMVKLVDELEYAHEYKPGNAAWKDEYVAKSDKKLAMKAYLNDPRVEGLVSLMKMKNAWVIFIFRDDTTLLRLDTPQPLDKAEILEKLINKMCAVAKVLELQDGEAARLKSDMTKEERAEVALEVDDAVFEEAGLDLEVEEGAEGVVVPPVVAPVEEAPVPETDVEPDAGLDDEPDKSA